MKKRKTVDIALALQKEKDLFEIELLAMRKVHPIIKYDFLSTPIELFEKETYEGEQYFPYEIHKLLEVVYYHLAFFPDEDILARFKKLGFKEKELMFFVPLQLIEDVFKDVAAKSPFFIKHTAFRYLRLYLQHRMRHIISKWAGYTIEYNKNVSMHISKKELRNFYRRRKTAQRNPFAKQSHLDRILEEHAIKPVEKSIGSVEKAKKIYEDLLTPNIDNAFFRELVTCCFPDKWTNERLRTLFPLFQVIAPHKKLLSDDSRLEVRDAYENTSDLCYQAKRVYELTRCTSSVFESF